MLLLIVLGLSALVSYTCPGIPENPVSAGPDREKTDNSSKPGSSRNQDRGLWLLTAKITQSRTMQLDTVIIIEEENFHWKEERHVSLRTVTHGQVTAVIKNQAEDPATEFQYDSDSGDPGTITVSGDGMHTESSRYEKTINGKLTNADIRDINVSGSASPGATIMFYYSPDSKNTSVGISINAKGTDNGRRFFNEWKDYSSERDKYILSCSGGCDVSGDKGCNITKTSTGYQATYRKTENKQRHTANGTEFITSENTLEITIKPYKEPDKPEVTLYGCSELSTEEQGEVFASGKPEGGKFRFWVEPGNLMEVQSDGESSAILTGKTPGKGTLYVEYTSPLGKTNTKSQPASCVKIENYNGGQAIPQIPLYDLEGKKLSGVLRVPLSAQPSNIEELVDFVPADKSFLSATGLSGAVELTGSRPGKTTLQAQTNCGNTTGPAVDVEVVNCTDETIARLEKQKQSAIENLKIAASDLQKLAGSKEFEKARDDLVASTWDLLTKVGVTIIAGGKTTGTAHTAAQIANYTVGLSDWIGSQSHEERFINGVKLAAGKIWGAAAGTLANMTSIAEAADRFYKNIAEIKLHEQDVKSASESWDKALNALKDVENRQQLCKRDKPQPKKTEEPKTDRTPEPSKPTPPKEPKPKTDTPPAKEQTTEEPTPPEPGDKEPPTPPPPTSEPRQVGLPYSPEDCGCDKAKEITINSTGISAIQAGVKNLGDCVEEFNSTAVPDFTETLRELSALTDALMVAAEGDPELFRMKARDAKPKLDSLIERTKSYDTAGKTFMKQFEKCPESVTTGMEVFKSALTVTIDSITTKY